MSRGAWLGVTLVSLAVGLAVSAPSAHALSCAQPVDRQGRGVPYPRPPVAFDAVFLSGPSVGQQLIRPARLAVLRYRRGSGPHWLRLSNGVDLVNGYVLTWGGMFEPEVGGVYRMGITPGGRRTRIRARETVAVDPCTDDAVPIRRLPSSLRPTRALAAASPAGEPWRARLVRGPFGLRCVEVRRGRTVGFRQRECERMARPTSAIASLRAAGGSTLVFAQSPRLRSVSIVTPGGERVVHAPRGSRLALAAYDGRLPATSVRVTLHFAGGGRRGIVPYGG